MLKKLLMSSGPLPPPLCALSRGLCERTLLRWSAGLVVPSPKGAVCLPGRLAPGRLPSLGQSSGPSASLRPDFHKVSQQRERRRDKGLRFREAAGWRHWRGVSERGRKVGRPRTVAHGDLGAAARLDTGGTASLHQVSPAHSGVLQTTRAQRTQPCSDTCRMRSMHGRFKEDPGWAQPSRSFLAERSV